MTFFSANFTTKLIPFFKIMLLNSQGIPANGFLSLYELCTEHFAGCPELLFLETRHRHTMRKMLLNQNGFLAIPPIMRLTSGKWSGSSFIQNEIFSYDSTQEKNHDSYPRCTDWSGGCTQRDHQVHLFLKNLSEELLVSHCLK